jgi:hypothetical protein
MRGQHLYQRHVLRTECDNHGMVAVIDGVHLGQQPVLVFRMQERRLALDERLGDLGLDFADGAGLDIVRLAANVCTHVGIELIAILIAYLFPGGVPFLLRVETPVLRLLLTEEVGLKGFADRGEDLARRVGSIP